MQEQPDVVAVIMAQLSLKMGLKTWKEKGRLAAKSEMKQLHMRDTFITKHYKYLDVVQRKLIIEYHMFLKEKKMEISKGELLPEATNRGILYPKSIPARRLCLRRQCYSVVLLTLRRNVMSQ